MTPRPHLNEDERGASWSGGKGNDGEIAGRALRAGRGEVARVPSNFSPTQGNNSSRGIRTGENKGYDWFNGT